MEFISLNSLLVPVIFKTRFALSSSQNKIIMRKISKIMQEIPRKGVLLISFMPCSSCRAS